MTLKHENNFRIATTGENNIYTYIIHNMYIEYNNNNTPIESTHTNVYTINL